MEGQKSISFVCLSVKAIAQFGCTAEDVFPLQINCAIRGVVFPLCL